MTASVCRHRPRRKASMQTVDYDDIARQIDELSSMTTDELAERYHELHGQPVRTRHRQYLIRKNAWRIQANAMGGLSERARRRAMELANDADIRVMAPRSFVCPPQGEAGDRGPPPTNPATRSSPRPAPRSSTSIWGPRKTQNTAERHICVFRCIWTVAGGSRDCESSGGSLVSRWP